MAKQGHRGWGKIRSLPSGKLQASYIGPDNQRHNATQTFDTKLDAETWLGTEKRLIDRDEWTAPKVRAERRRTGTFAVYAAAWLPMRKVRGRPLAPRTIAGYQRLLDDVINPTFGSTEIRHISPEAVRHWFAHLDNGKTKPTPTQNAHAYALLKAILATAVDEDIIAANPCRVRGAGQARRASKTTIATPNQIRKLISEIAERYRAMTALMCWCGLRWGEVTELRRKDIDLKNKVVHVRRGVTLVGGEFVVGPPKSEAGIRDVHIPENVMPLLRRHLERAGVAGRDQLLFASAGDPSKHLRTASYHKVFTTAKAKAGLPTTFRVHDMRHTALSNATAVGAGLTDVMALAGHSTTSAALRYQHQIEGRGREIAAALAKLADS